ncbi:hypothetical protein FQA39_LY02051 [Lamprigera yunnana]|nr:hypothetical protein FQA39_LY02051 [Lamprigera yunnana]
MNTHNIKAVRVCSEEEAMMLLLIGDSNRITVETSRNLNSSRSHCIFTINIVSKYSKTGQLKSTKLNLIDLAGSERIYKTKIIGQTLKEAKSINLSLHYLQHVVTALSEKKSHVPFRNSMLTYILKDSLGSNCVTVMLVTLDLVTYNLEQETVATCKFSQRVGNVVITSEMNKETSPKEEIVYLRNIIQDLQTELNNATKFKLKEVLQKCPINSVEIRQNICKQQTIYKETLLKLKTLQAELKRLKFGFTSEMESIFGKFNQWCQHRIKSNDNENSVKINNIRFFGDCWESEKENSFSINNSSYIGELNKTNDSISNTKNDALNNNKIRSPQASNLNVFSLNDFNEQSGTINLYDDIHFDTSSSLQNNVNYKNTWITPERDLSVDNEVGKDRGISVMNNLLTKNDPPEFREFLSKVPFTGDDEVDEEIIRFYRTKFLYGINM